MVPQVEDDLIAQMLEIKTNGKMIVIMFYWWINCIRKVIGYYDTNKSCKVSHKSVDCYNAKWFMAYCLSLTIILDMHCWQIGIRSAPWAGSWQEIQSKARMTQERKENCLKTRTPRTMLFLRGKGCNIPPVYPKVSCNYECCFSGEELKAKATPERPCNYIE